MFDSDHVRSFCSLSVEKLSNDICTRQHCEKKSTEKVQNISGQQICPDIAYSREYGICTGQVSVAGRGFEYPTKGEYFSVGGGPR